MFNELYQLDGLSVIANVGVEQLKKRVTAAIKSIEQYNSSLDKEAKASKIIDRETYSKEFPSHGFVSDFGVHRSLHNPEVNHFSELLAKQSKKNIPLVVSRVKWNDNESVCTLAGDYRVLCYIPEHDWIEIIPMNPADNNGNKYKISSVVIDAFDQLVELLNLFAINLKTKDDLENKICERYVYVCYMSFQSVTRTLLYLTHFF